MTISHAVSTARVALYYAPELNDPLWAAGASWLGFDPETGEASPQPNVEGIVEATADPRKYGFHATLKPPLRLSPGVSFDAFEDLAWRIADNIAPFELPPLAVSDIKGFLALRETRASPELQNLSDRFVEGLDEMRDPPGEAELAKRRHGALTPEQNAMLARWGYPYVFGTWFFHMTLTRRLPPEGHAIFRPAAEAYFADAVAMPRRVDDVCIFTQAAPDAAFRLASRIPLRGGPR